MVRGDYQTKCVLMAVLSMDACVLRPAAAAAATSSCCIISSSRCAPGAPNAPSAQRVVRDPIELRAIAVGEVCRRVRTQLQAGLGFVLEHVDQLLARCKAWRAVRDRLAD